MCEYDRYGEGIYGAWLVIDLLINPRGRKQNWAYECGNIHSVITGCVNMWSPIPDPHHVAPCSSV